MLGAAVRYIVGLWFGWLACLAALGRGALAGGKVAVWLCGVPYSANTTFGEFELRTEMDHER